MTITFIRLHSYKYQTFFWKKKKKKCLILPTILALRELILPVNCGQENHSLTKHHHSVSTMTTLLPKEIIRTKNNHEFTLRPTSDFLPTHNFPTRTCLPHEKKTEVTRGRQRAAMRRDGFLGISSSSPRGEASEGRAESRAADRIVAAVQESSTLGFSRGRAKRRVVSFPGAHRSLNSRRRRTR